MGHIPDNFSTTGGVEGLLGQDGPYFAFCTFDKKPIIICSAKHVEKNMEKNVCTVSRWEMLKTQLNNLTPEAFVKMAEQHPNAKILDVRTAAEFRNGTILNAENMDYLGDQFWDQFEHLPTDRHLLVFCRTGRRSVRVCTLLKNAGFTRVYNMDGGLTAWDQLKEAEQD